MKMSRVPLLMAAAAAAVLSCAVTGPVFAGGGTFAQFFQSTANNAFHFTNSGSSGTFITNAVPVTFEFLKPTSYGAAGTPISATLTFVATTNGPASTSGGTTTESFGSVSAIFSTGSGASKVNLLTLTATGDIAGTAGGNAAALFGSSKSGDTVSFTSGVLSGLGDKGDYSLSFSSLQPAFLTASDGILESFKASGTGTFGAPVPEASTMISFGVLLLGGAILIFARRKQTAGSVA
jgi:hypothetical protein